jgi:hypothetical protein
VKWRPANLVVLGLRLQPYATADSVGDECNEAPNEASGISSRWKIKFIVWPIFVRRKQFKFSSFGG